MIVVAEIPVPLARFVNVALFGWLAYVLCAFFRRLRSQLRDLCEIKRYKRALDLCEKKARLGGLTVLEREELDEHMAWAVVEQQKRSSLAALKEMKT